MALKPPLLDLPIKTADSGFYKGFSRDVTIASKFAIGGLVIWAIAFPEQAGAILSTFNSFILTNFATWYIWAVALFVVMCIGLAIWPTAGRLLLGQPGDKPEFGNFSWFSMMFGAGIGVGMLTWAVAEPVYHFNNNPEVIQGLTTGGAADNIRMAYKWSFLHWGIGAWACYALAGLALAFFSYRRGLPLTMRSSLTPIFGKTLSGPVGHLVDIVAVVATILGVAQTLGFGVEQFVSGLTRIGINGLTNEAGTANTMGVLVAIFVIMAASTLSALSGVGKGIKWLSNLNMGLSIFLLTFFLLFGSTFFGLQALVLGLWDYLIALPDMMFRVWRTDGTETGDALANWQGAWSVFYWAWWIAFAPFVGLFLARISRGRTIREFVLGAMIVPSLMCFVWFTWAGGTAIDLELNGGANGVINSAPDGDKIFAMVQYMLSPFLGWAMAAIIVVLLMTYLVTTADSAVLIVNTINAAGDEGPKARPHILFWGVALGSVVAALLLVPGGGLKAIQTAMVIGALPFSLVMILMCVALIKAIYLDGKREAAGIPTTYSEAGTEPAE
ncbi:BCCT family transporter [Thalassococcus sp. S3]|uniref:BCCT family transporter n=1 Tax=Thalassococcus sp. S3 TaxID=2017482 RepID=UPI001024125D|nr:BCCT family transporter [Thalassococcus sp. S3]QBF32069.1 transporter [Thalassococcus sp. S3]